MTNNPTTSAVPAPPGLSPPVSSQPVDTLQDLISRKREADKNKLKYHLTEADCSLLCSHGTPINFTAGEVIVPAGSFVTKVYRIKSGKIGLFREDVKVKEMTRGYFLGETLFVRSTMKSILGFAAVAITDVEAIEVNLSFVKQLLSVDKSMAFKVYRHLASKLSAFLFLSLSHIAENPEMQSYVLSRGLHSSSSSDTSTSSDMSDTGSVTDEQTTTSSSVASSSSVSSVSSATSIPTKTDSRSSVGSAGEDLGMQIYLQLKAKPLHVAPRKAKLKSGPFRTFTLDSPHGQCMLFPGRLKFTCTLRQRKIKYSHIMDITKVAATCVTIIYKLQAKTIFFKTPEETDEFMGLVKSLRLTSSKPSSPSGPSGPSTPTSLASFISDSPSASPSSFNPLALSYDDVTENDKILLNSLCVRQDLKKGDVVVAEGDLYQRIYTVVQGQISSYKNTRLIMSINAGETFGVLTLFHLRPSTVNLVVTSDTATVLIIPGYRINELVTTNFPLAVRMYKKAAQVIYTQIEYTLTGTNNEPLQGSNRALV